MRVALTLVSCVILSACGFGTGSAGTPDTSQTTDSPATASAPRIEPAPVTPTAPGTHLPIFACADASGGAAGTASVSEVRVAEQAGYDRFVIQFNSAVPAYTVKRQANPTFTMSPSGQPITLSGTAGALVQVPSAIGATYSGSIDLQNPDFIVIKEARQTENFEGHVSWALGLSRAACLRTFTLSNPARLVVDFTTTG